MGHPNVVAGLGNKCNGKVRSRSLRDDNQKNNFLLFLFGDGAVAECAEFVDGDDDLFVGFEPALGVAAETNSLGGSGADDVSGFEWRGAGDVGDEGWDLEDE